ncbi:MAG: DUF421 domain-containing protein [Bacteroidetes bacterium]|nr:DUF421 domain-containing protein [Bacteroidota bacterium]
MSVLIELFGEGKDLTALQMSMRALVIFLSGIILVRIAGRRSFGMREPFDNVLSILLGAILARCVVGASEFGPTFTACFVLVFLHLIFGKLSYYSDGFGKIIKGEPKVLFEKGVMNKKNMSNCMISEKDMMEGIHLNGIEALDDVKVVYQERNGEMSVIKKK